MFIREEYRRLKPPKEELRRFSLTPIARILLVITALLILIASINAISNANRLDGKYYNIYLHERIKVTERIKYID
jgi:hypothetical protein